MDSLLNILLLLLHHHLLLLLFLLLLRLALIVCVSYVWIFSRYRHCSAFWIVCNSEMKTFPTVILFYLCIFNEFWLVLIKKKEKNRTKKKILENCKLKQKEYDKKLLDILKCQSCWGNYNFFCECLLPFILFNVYDKPLAFT